MNQELNDKMMQTIGLMRYQRRLFRRQGDIRSDPSQGQGRVLAALKLQDGISTKDLAYVLGLHPASLNETLAKLSREGYVTREQSPEDRRIMLVTLTDKGRELQQQGKPSPLGDTFDCLDESEQKTMIGYLDRINTALREKLGVDEDFDPTALRGPKRGPGRGPHGGHGPQHGMGPHGGHGPKNRGPHGYPPEPPSPEEFPGQEFPPEPVPSEDFPAEKFVSEPLPPENIDDQD